MLSQRVEPGILASYPDVAQQKWTLSETLRRESSSIDSELGTEFAQGSARRAAR